MRSLLIRRNRGIRGPCGASSSGEIGEQGGFHEPPYLAESGEREAMRSRLIRRNWGKGRPLEASSFGGIEEKGGHVEPLGRRRTLFLPEEEEGEDEGDGDGGQPAHAQLI